ncbi:MAG TPA: pyrimidine reductase family protein [Nocardioidaceae bacterium]|nr:pyrimidine reductase family protein [Nocardioidaceae bacterium]
MQRLLPGPSLPELADNDLVELYGFPARPKGPWVRANFVTTLDGAAQGADHRSGTLSPPADARIFALLRSLCDVILVGAGTTRAEGYQPVRKEEVNAGLRAEHGLAALPAIAVVSRSLDLDPALVRGAEAPTIVVTVASAPADRLAAIRAAAPVVVAGEERVDLDLAVASLGAAGHRAVLCEGGPSLLHGLVASGRLDDLCLTLTPQLVAGSRLRIVNGAAVEPPATMALAHLLAEDGVLFARYTAA